MLTPADLARRGGLVLDGDPGPDGVPREPVCWVDLSSGLGADALVAVRGALVPVIGVSREPVTDPLAAELDLVVAPGSGRWSVPSLDVGTVEARVRAAPLATLTLARLLRATAQLGVRDGLAAESAAYSVLLAGPERARLLAPRPRPADDGPRVSVDLDGPVLRVQLVRPDRCNRVDARLRDELCNALQLALVDPGLIVHLSALGGDWSTGGDLDEFGSLPDPATAHVVRQARSVGWLLHALGDRVTVHLQGRCLGSGIEMPAFAHRVTAEASLRAVLPELGLGLVPGAGGTVSLTRRIGRWRTLWMVLTGEAVDAATALEWGLVDELTPSP